MTDGNGPRAGRVRDLSLTNPGADALPAGSYWEAHRYIGAVPLSPASRVHVNAVRKDGAWYLRLRAYRRARRGATDAWVAAQQNLIFPPEAVPALQELLAAGGRTLAALAGDGLSEGELARELATELPDRDALSIIDPSLPPTTL